MENPIRGLKGPEGPCLPTIYKNGKGHKLRRNIVLRSGLVNSNVRVPKKKQDVFISIFATSENALEPPKL